MTSFEGEAIRKAKLALNKAIKKGYSSITDRFNRDNTYMRALFRLLVKRVAPRK